MRYWLPSDDTNACHLSFRGKKMIFIYLEEERKNNARSGFVSVDVSGCWQKQFCNRWVLLQLNAIVTERLTP
jgi:hypothetical protein